MVQSPIQPKKQDEYEQWGWELEATGKEGSWTKFEKGGVGNIGGLAALCQL